MSGRLIACVGLVALAAMSTPELAGATTEPPRDALEGFACHHSPNALNRSISIEAVMRPVPGTHKMLMKFQLFRKTPHSHTFLDVSGGDLGRWITPSNPTLGQRPDDQWNVQKQVVNLTAPADYRFEVSFHWVGSGDRSLGTVAKLSRACDEQ